MRKAHAIVLALLFGAFGMQGCYDGLLPYYPPGNDDPINNPEPIDAVVGHDWTLAGFETIGPDGITMESVPDDQLFTLMLGADGHASGNADCKGYAYSYKSDGIGTIEFYDPAPQIMLYCGDESYDTRYYAAMASANAYEANGTTLRIYYGDRSEALYFTREAKGTTENVIRLVALELYDPIPSDPFTLLDASISGDILSLTVQYGGGCADHEFSLVGPLTIAEGDPTPIPIFLQHRANGDMCEALLTETITFDLTPLRNHWMSETGRSEGTMELSIDDLHKGIAAQLLYVVGNPSGGNDPSWIRDTIQAIMSRPVTSPAESIYRNKYDGQIVYFRPQICCDIFSVLYDYDGNVICHPDGGIAGMGDGRCPDYIDYRRTEELVWQDPR